MTAGLQVELELGSLLGQLDYVFSCDDQSSWIVHDVVVFLVNQTKLALNDLMIWFDCFQIRVFGGWLLEMTGAVAILEMTSLLVG